MRSKTRSVTVRLNAPMALMALIVVNTMGSAGPVQAAALAYMEPRVLEPGERLQQALTQVETDGARVQITLGVAPAGARLIVDETGQLIIDWQSGPDLADETVLELIATDIDSGEQLESRYLLVRRASRDSGQSAADAPLTESLDSPSRSVAGQQVTPAAADALPTVDTAGGAVAELPASEPRREVTLAADAVKAPPGQIDSDPDLPVLVPLANQVISAGRVVNLRVSASIADGTTPVLQIDRLPRNASFDANEDGSRTFYWQTGDKDQGEHLFRFTAINPQDSRLQSWNEILIVVGDPSRNKTIPATASPAVNE